MSFDHHSRLHVFQAYLRTGRAPRWTMQPSDIHGFLTGLAMSGPLPAESWLPVIFSGEDPVFATAHEKWTVLTDLMNFDDRIRANMGSYRLVTPDDLPDAGDGWYDAADWSEGFLQAIETNPQPWQRAVDLAEASLAIVLAACYHNHDAANSGHLSDKGLNELNYHLRHLNRVMQGGETMPQTLHKAA